MIAPRRRAYRLVAEAEAFSIPQIMAFTVLNLARGRNKRRAKRQNRQPPLGLKNQLKTPSAMAFARAYQ